MSSWEGLSHFLYLHRQFIHAKLTLERVLCGGIILHAPNKGQPMIIEMLI
ncbi:17618_t:CDS:1, partial [Gigaspora margarita]